MPDRPLRHARRRALPVLLAALALGAAAVRSAAAPPVPVPAQTTTIPASSQTTTAPAPGPPAQPPAEGSVVGATVSVPPAADAGAAPRARAARAARRRAHAAAADPGVTIRDFSFGPSAVTIHVGETITWTNDGPTAHTATGSGFDTGILSRGRSASHTFTSAGTFSYHCTLHPFMKGTVIVVAASGGGGGSTSGASSPTSGGSAGTAASGAPPSGATGAVPAASPAGAAAAGAQAQALPRTGLDAWQVAAVGALLLLAGAVLRRRTRPH